MAKRYDLIGDVNGDGKITMFDLFLALQAVIGNVVLTDEQFARADVTEDGEITVDDVKAIEKHIRCVELITKMNIIDD